MIRIISLAVLLLSAAQAFSQTHFKSQNYDVVLYKIVNLTNDESHIYDDVEHLSVKTGVNVYDEEFLHFEFSNVAGDQSYVAYFRGDDADGRSRIEKLMMVNDDGEEIAESAAYFAHTREIEEDVAYDIGVLIPDYDRGILHQILLVYDVDYVRGKLNWYMPESDMITAYIYFRGEEFSKRTLTMSMDDDSSIYFYEPNMERAFFAVVPEDEGVLDLKEIEVPVTENQTFWFKDNSGQIYVQIDDAMWPVELTKKGKEYRTISNEDGEHYAIDDPEELAPLVLLPTTMKTK